MGKKLDTGLDIPAMKEEKPNLLQEIHDSNTEILKAVLELTKTIKEMQQSTLLQLKAGRH